MRVEQLEEGVLCSLKMGRWAASVRMPKSKLGKSVPKEIVRAMQDLISDRTLLKDLATIRRSAKGLLLRSSIPFPVNGVFFVPKDQINNLDESFTSFMAEKEIRLEKLISNYKRLKKQFKKKYPDYYSEKYYPTEARLRRKFYFSWQFFQFTLPDEGAKVLSPAIYKKEQEKFQQMVGLMEEMTISLVGNMLHRRLDKLAKQCDSGKINAGTVHSVDRFLSRWDDLWRGHVDDKKMRMIMNQLKRQMKEASAERLKNNDEFRGEVGDKIGSLMSKLQKLPNFELKRKLDI
jgi:hypothetical protein